MDHDQEMQLRAILEIEGFPPDTIEAIIENARRNPLDAGTWIEIMKVRSQRTET